MSAIKDDLISAVQTSLAKNEVQMNKKETEAVIDAVLDGLLKTCQGKESVRTKLGTFTWVFNEACVRKNPRNGEEVQVPAYSTLKFKASKTIRVTADAKKTKAPAAKAAPAKAAAPAAKAAPKKIGAKK